MIEREVFLEALEMPTPESRAAYLRAACGRDATLRRKVDDLLKEHFSDDSLLAGPALEGERTAEVKSPAKEIPAQVIGRYKLLEKIGEGGFGEVWMAEQREPVKRHVALKIIKLGMDSRQIVARFEAERQALAMMDHPNIAKIFDAGTTENPHPASGHPLPSDGRGAGGEGVLQPQIANRKSEISQGRPYFVMELVRGIKITEYCDQNQLPTQERLRLFILVCQAIQHAHQKGIIHRDIKPSNILVTLHDGVPVPKVIDFGIAKATQGELTDKTVFTQFQQFIGTPAYISPEQAEMSGLDIDTRADIYSLGVLLYELLVGQTPFDTKEIMQGGLDALRQIIREKEPLRPSTKLNTLQGDARTTAGKCRQTDVGKLVHQLQGDLDWIVMRCLEKDRTRRYDTANGLAMDIQRHLNNEPVIARPPGAAYKFQKAWRRNKLAFSAAAAVLCVLILGVVVSTWHAVRATHAEREQSRLREEAEGLRANEAKLRREAEEARRNEATLRQQAEAREKLVKARVLCDQLKFDEAEQMVSLIPASALLTERRDSAIVFSALTDFHARHVRWKEAVPHATKAVECKPTEVVYYFSLLTLLAAHGDLENYRLYCRELLDRFRDEAHHGEGIAKACLMLPSSGVDLALVDGMADGGLAARINDVYLPYSQFAKGLAEYRQSRFASAAEWTRKSIDDPFYGAGHSRYVQSYMVLAMAQHQLNEHEEARAAFAKGKEIEQTKLPTLDSGDLGSGWYWRDWIVAHALMKEAKALIEGQSSTPKEPTQK